jgi:hypothetical protein
LVLWQMEKLLDGESVLPEERQDLGLCLQLGTKVWARAQMMAPTDEVQAALDDYLGFAQLLLDRASAPPMPMPGAAAPPMGGVSPAPAALPAVAQQAA